MQVSVIVPIITKKKISNRGNPVTRSCRRCLRVQAAGRTITKYHIALLGIVLVGTFLWIYHLDTQSLWFGEVYSVWASSLSVPQIAQRAAVTDPNPFSTTVRYTTDDGFWRVKLCCEASVDSFRDPLNTHNLVVSR